MNEAETFKNVIENLVEDMKMLVDNLKKDFDDLCPNIDDDRDFQEFLKKYFHGDILQNNFVQPYVKTFTRLNVRSRNDFEELQNRHEWVSGTTEKGKILFDHEFYFFMF